MSVYDLVIISLAAIMASAWFVSTLIAAHKPHESDHL